MDYLDILINQYKDATGYDITDENIDELIEWCVERNEISHQYLNLLFFKCLFDVPTPKTFEVGKGSLDTIVRENFQTNILTPFDIGLYGKTSGFVLKGNLKIAKNNPYCVNDIDNVTRLNVIDIPGITFMTQNIYLNSNIRNWEQLHNSRNYNIIVGAFGKIYDKDRLKKISVLEKFRERLIGEVEEEYIDMDDNYLYVVASNPERKLINPDKKLILK